jgi:hypothetical protein
MKKVNFINSSLNEGVTPSGIALSFDGFSSISRHYFLGYFGKMKKIKNSLFKPSYTSLMTTNQPMFVLAKQIQGQYLDIFAIFGGLHI